MVGEHLRRQDKGERKISGLNWFSGGNDRQQQASLLIKDLVADLKQSGGKESLQKVLLSFDEELKRGESSFKSYDSSSFNSFKGTSDHLISEKICSIG